MAHILAWLVLGVLVLIVLYEVLAVLLVIHRGREVANALVHVRSSPVFAMLLLSLPLLLKILRICLDCVVAPAYTFCERMSIHNVYRQY